MTIIGGRIKNCKETITNEKLGTLRKSQSVVMFLSGHKLGDFALVRAANHGTLGMVPQTAGVCSTAAWFRIEG